MVDAALDPGSRLARIARRQLGVWTRAQAIAGGFTDKMIRTRLARGDWLTLDRGVYAHATSIPTWERSVIAAVLAEPSAHASHRTAAVLHGLEGFRRGRPEITVPPGANARGRLALVHRGVDITTTRIGSIPTVDVAQTFVDLAQVAPARLARALAEHLRSSPSSLELIRDRYGALAPRGGRDLRPLRAALLPYGTDAPCTISELERVLREVLTHEDIPPIEWESPFPGRSSSDERVDGLIRPWGLVIEGDGRAWHTRVDDFERDRRRDAEAAAAGLLTMRYTWKQLTEQPAWVRRTTIEAGLRRAA